jgi:hypothetical protein
MFESEKVPVIPVITYEPTGSTGLGDVPGNTPVFGFGSYVSTNEVLMPEPDMVKPSTVAFAGALAAPAIITLAANNNFDFMVTSLDVEQGTLRRD